MKKLAAFVFPGFQTLDLFGPVEMLGAVDDRIELIVVGETGEPVVNRHGLQLGVDRSIKDGTDYDYLFLPGGDSALDVAKNESVREWIIATAARAELVMAVCTGSILLASTGLLDGRSATTNKYDFADTTPLAPNVQWQGKARWVEDGKYFTSSGVAAGIDMTLGALSNIFDRETAEKIARETEYDWHTDASWDPFAKHYGLA